MLQMGGGVLVLSCVVRVESVPSVVIQRELIPLIERASSCPTFSCCLPAAHSFFNRFLIMVVVNYGSTGVILLTMSVIPLYVILPPLWAFIVSNSVIM